MIWLKRILALLALTVIGIFTLQWAASETSGEVVVLTTTDSAGAPAETRLWIVDSGGEAWLRAGSESTGWYQQLIATPTVTLTRNGETNSYTAIPVPAARNTINGLFRAKYSWGEKVIGKLADRSGAIAVRLEPAG